MAMPDRALLDQRAEWRRTNQEHFWALVRGAKTASNRVADIDQMTHTDGDPVGGSIVGRLKIIAANHDDN
jgi:hypothetical protein